MQIKMEGIQISLPDDISLKIASSLQDSDLCALASCSRFWRELCESDSLWESLARERWPFLGLLNSSASSSSSSSSASNKTHIFEGWRCCYITRHNEIARRTKEVVKFVEQSSSSASMEVKDYLKAIDELCKMLLGFKDVQLFLFKPKHNVILNLIGLHYSINWLGIPGDYVMEALEQYKISDRHVCVKWWKLGRWSHGFRMRDESHSRWVSLADLTMATKLDKEILAVLHRGARHEVLRVQILSANPTSTPWSC